MAKRRFRRDTALRLLEEAENRLRRAINYIAAGEDNETPDDVACSFDTVNPEFRRTLAKLEGFIRAARRG